MPAPNTPDTRGRFHLLLLLLLAAAFAGVLLWMLNLRLSSGDTFPPYSTYRTDPIGTRALHDALRNLDATSTSRNTKRIQFLNPDNQTAVLFLGLNPRQLEWQDDSERGLIERWLDQGCHIVIALGPLPEDYKDRVDSRGWMKPKKDKQKEKEKDEEKNNKSDKEKESEPTEEERELARKYEGIFGLTAKRESKRRTDLPQTPQAAFTGLTLPVWHGTHVLESKPESKWTTLATADGQPTIAMFNRGNGSIIVTTDPYPFSNEAQTKDRHTSYLLALLANKSRILFDESHLGVLNEPGLVKLLRQYHLHGILAGGLLLFAILLWQGAGSLIPVDPDKDLGADANGTSSGRDSSDGLVALLETGLPPAKLLDECVSRHLAAHPARRPPDETILEARMKAGKTGAGKLSGDYQKITRLFSKAHR